MCALASARSTEKPSVAFENEMLLDTSTETSPSSVYTGMTARLRMRVANSSTSLVDVTSVTIMANSAPFTRESVAFPGSSWLKRMPTDRSTALPILRP